MIHLLKIKTADSEHSRNVTRCD